jgi:tetrathionate reductase subunit B
LERAFLPDDTLYAHIRECLAQTGGRNLLVITCQRGEQLVAASCAHTSVAILTLPSLLIVNETHVLHALRCGAASVVLIGCRACHYGKPALLDTSLQVARALCGDQTRVVYLEDDGSPAATAALQACIATSALAPDRSEVLAALPSAGKQPRRVVLAELLSGEVETSVSADSVLGVPFATVTVEDDGCTLCGACSRICPTKALGYEPAGGELTFAAIDCVNCGLCAQACPEKVLTLTPGLRIDRDLLTRRVLVADDVVPCQRCGQPYTPTRLLAHARAKLTQTAGPRAAATRQIELCFACRSVAPEVPYATPTLTATDGRTLLCDEGQPIATDAAQRATPLRLDRRSFLGTAASTAVTMASSLLGRDKPAQANPPAAKTRQRLAMAIDLERCIGCHACTVACKAENDVPLGVFRDWVEEHQLGQYPHARPYFLPKLCNHCDDPGCLRACPTGAIHMRPDGIVDLNHDICIGCRACNQACPYGATFMDPVRGTADKCNFCAHRVDQGLRPACVDICPSQCRIFGDLNDAQSPVSRYLRDKPTQVLRQDLGLGPNVRYVALPGELNR